jgi:hypothetical protein
MAHVPCCELHKFTSTDGDRPTWAPHDFHQATVLTTQTFCRHLTVVNKGLLSMSIPWHGGQCGTFDSDQDTTRSNRRFQLGAPHLFIANGLLL